ncbi:MAG: sulfotransferase [Sphingomonas sp.]|nr:tetratricopeptide repeat-containing sulfotransferase family protein [Sphingomonas sp.]MBA3666502.1 sulfotransferase [Sphingomonas sp.]
MQAALALHDNQLHVAEPLLKAHLKDDPFDAKAIRMLAELAWRIGRLADAEHLLRRAVEIAPGFTAARAQLALVLGRMGRPAEALPLLDLLFEQDGEDIGHFNLKAATVARLGDFEEAIALYETVLQRAPKQPRVWLSYGHMLKTVGRQAEGIAAYRRAIELNPALGEAWFSLSNLKTVTFDVGDVAAMEAALADHAVRDEDRFHLDFALGKAMHDAGKAQKAFAHYAAGNALRLTRHPYDRERVRRSVDRAISTYTTEAIAARPGGCTAPDPIFIVGMPRAGSTLVEQILASHSQVEGTSELPDLPLLARKVTGYPQGALDLSEGERVAIGEQYLERASVQRRTDRPYFIDKLPNNWLFVPFIQLVLPNAKIIDARRHPLGCCLSNYRQHFARGQDFTYDLTDVGSYYAEYVRLMAHVDAILLGKVHRVIYEQMVDDTEAEVRALLAHVGLDYEPGCLAFHETKRAVRTASSEQVRQPIYRQATEDWQRYEAFIEPLKAALGPVLDAYPGVPASFGQR